MLQVKGCVDWIFAWVGTCDAISAAVFGVMGVVALRGEGEEGEK